MCTDNAAPLAGRSGNSGPVQSPEMATLALRLERVEVALHGLGTRAEHLADTLHFQYHASADPVRAAAHARAVEALVAELFAARAEVSVLAAELRPTGLTGDAP